MFRKNISLQFIFKAVSIRPGRLFKSFILGLALCAPVGSVAIAQRPGRQFPTRQFCLQDDRSGMTLSFNNNGIYQFLERTGSTTIEGRGRIEINGCKITFVADDGVRLIQAEIDTCLNSGKASVLLQDDCDSDVDCKPKQFVLSDSNTRDSSCLGYK